MAAHHGSARGTILITARSFGLNDPAHLQRLRDAGYEIVECREGAGFESDCLSLHLGGACGWIVSTAPVSADTLRHAPNLRAVVKHGVGVDNIDVAECARRSITVANAPGQNHTPVADLTIGLMLGLSRQIYSAHRSVVEGEWPRVMGVGLGGKSVAVLGLGRIGMAVAERVRAFGCTVIAFDPPAAKRGGVPDWIELAPTIEKAVADADFVSIHLPLADETRRIISDNLIAGMKRGAFVVNTARGGVVDERSIHSALVEKRIGGYATDVFEQEPPTGSPLLSLDNVLFTPHIASYTKDSMVRLGDDVVDAILSALDGIRPATAIN